MKTQNRRYPRSFRMNGDKSGESGAFLFSRRVPDFCDGRRSFPTNENSNLYRRGRRCPSAMDFAHHQSPKLLGSSPRQIHNLENLGQISGEYPIYMKTRLKRGQIWRIRSVSIFQRVSDFCDGRRSFPANENSNLYRRGRRRPSASVGDEFRSLPIPK